MSFQFDSGIFSIDGLSGEILPGASLAWYETGSSAPLATYSDPDLTVPNTNPVVVAADGRLPPIWLQDVSYKLVVSLPNGTIISRDPIRNPSADLAIDVEQRALKAGDDRISVSREGGAYDPSPSYQAGVTYSSFAGFSGKMGAPVANAVATGYFSKASTNHAFNAPVGVAHKYGNQYEDRATAVFGQAVDYVGVYGSFVEGGRFEGTLINGHQGAAYGAICSAGVDPNTGATDPRLLVGCEADVNDQLGPDAPLFGAFNRDRFRTTFLASQGVGVGGDFKVDAAFVCNPYSLGKFQTGFLLTECVADTGVAAASGTVMAKGIDLSLAALSYASLVAPNNAPIRFQSADGLVGLNVINVTPDNNIQIGQSGVGRAIFTTIPYAALGRIQMQPIPFADLPAPTADRDGTIAFVGDAASPITTWHQVVTAGGGVNPAYVQCLGGAWRAF